MSDTLLQVRGLSKTYPGLCALHELDLSVDRGEILAVVGQNGSGKSTLVKILAGVCDPDPGATIEVRGRDGERLTGGDAQRELHFIHQDLGLIADLSTIENLDLGRGWACRRRRAARRCSAPRRRSDASGRRST